MWKRSMRAFGADRYPTVMSVGGIVLVFLRISPSVQHCAPITLFNDKSRYSIIRDITFSFHPFLLFFYITYNATVWHHWKQYIRLHAASSSSFFPTFVVCKSCKRWTHVDLPFKNTITNWYQICTIKCNNTDGEINKCILYDIILIGKYDLVICIMIIKKCYASLMLKIMDSLGTKIDQGPF